MTKIIVRFSEKTSSPSLKDAIHIAEKCEHYIEDRFYFVHFNEVNKNLEKLIEIVGRWKSTQIYVDDKEVEMGKFRDTFLCYYKLLCNGNCMHPHIGVMRIDEFSENIRVKNNTGYVDEYTIRSLTPFLEKINEKKFKLNKEKLVDYIKDEWFFQLEYCPIINTDRTLSLIDKLPDVIEIRDSLDYEEKREVEIDEESYRKIAEIFADVFEKRFRKVLKEELKGKR